MNEILVTIMLLIPSPDKAVDWTLNQVPTQIQLTHKNGFEASYHSQRVPCDRGTHSETEMMFMSEQGSPTDNVCYIIPDITNPQFVRHPDYWYSVGEHK